MTALYRGPSMRRSPLLPIFLIVLVDVLGMTIVIPLLATGRVRTPGTPRIEAITATAAGPLGPVVAVPAPRAEPLTFVHSFILPSVSRGTQNTPRG